MKQYLRPEKSNFNKYSIGAHFIAFLNKIELTFLIILSLIFISMSRSDHALTKYISNTIFNISMPVVNILSYPFKTTYDLILDFQDLVNAKEQNILLKEENEQLRGILVDSIYIKNENEELKRILKFVVPKSTNYMTVQIIGRSYGLFNHNFTVKHDQDAVVKDGSIVVYKKSVIGRVVETFGSKSRVMLLTDAKSRIPIVSANSRDRGILTGKNSDTMQIEYLSKDHNIQEGELIFTSSDGNQIPPGILTGVVTKVSSEKVYVKIAEDIANIDHITILQYWFIKVCA